MIPDPLLQIVFPNSAPVVTVTGGTGSFGRAFVRHLLSSTSARVRVVSRDEHKQAGMCNEFPAGPRLTYILGDIRDADTMRVACHSADYVVHAAALKIVGMGEQHPDEFAAVNIAGTRTVIQAALESGVRRLLMVSTDKAVNPINLYGASKMTAERLVIHANKLGATRGLRAACIRGGNIWASNGSVANVWQAAKTAGKPIVINGPQVTRFHLVMPDWIAFAWRALTEMHGGEIFVPKAAAWSLGDLAQVFGASFIYDAMRPGDKRDESLYSGDEAGRTVDAGWSYIVQPPADLRAVWDYMQWDCPPVGARPYTSATTRQMTAGELQALVKETFGQ